MKVLIDTCVWSLALRRRNRELPKEALEVDRLLAQGRVIIIGPVRQELLSGVRDSTWFDRLAGRLAPFPDEPIHTDDYVEAARIFNMCRAKGVQGSNTDFLICAVTLRVGAAVFTTDRDFRNYQRIASIRLHHRESDL